jgi:hypothetical protein
MEEMKVTKLVKYLKETSYIHKKNKNISLNLKHKIYESYYEKAKNQSKNKFGEYFKSF